MAVAGLPGPTCSEGPSLPALLPSGRFWGSSFWGRGMAANQARKSAPTRLKMRSRAGMIYNSNLKT